MCPLLFFTQKTTSWYEDCGVIVLPCGPHDQDAEAQPLSPTLKRGWRRLGEFFGCVKRRFDDLYVKKV